MIPVQVRNVIFGEGIPKIAVPIMPKSYEDIEIEVNTLKDTYYDVIEWRVDHYHDISKQALMRALNQIHKLLKDTIVLATFRTVEQGGVKEISDQDYLDIVSLLITSNCIDMIDIEYVCDNKLELIELAHQNDVIVVMSDHHFNNTPSTKSMKKRLKKMSKTGSDIVKIAVMPSDYNDVLNLMKATYKIKEELDTPIISMSMSEVGVTSRMLGEIFGSVMTFGCATNASAPGQVNANKVKELLETLHVL